MSHLSRWIRVTPVQITALSALVLAVATVFHWQFRLVLQPEVYLPLHSLLEISSVVVSFSIFALYVNGHRDARDARGLFIGTGFLAVAILDTFHTLSFPGMPVFVTPSSTEKGIYFWLAARLWGIAVLLAALFIYPKSRAPLLKLRWLLAANLGISILVFSVVSYSPASLPRMFVTGQGLTPLKILLEYAGAGLAVAGAVLYFRAARQSEDRFFADVGTGLVLIVFSQLCFSLYAAAYDTFNLVGHLFKIASCYFIFRGFFVAAIRRPYLALERLREEAQVELDRTVARLAETTRAERRARERAEAAIEMLRPLQTVEVASLSDRKLEDLLCDLLERARMALGADCATVFQLTDDGSALSVRASVGLDEGAREQTFIPLGAGIAGAIALKGEPMVIADVAEFELVNPGMRQRVSSVMGAPLRAAGKTIGVIHVGAVGVRQFTEPDLYLLQLVGEGVASAVERARIHGELEATFNSMASSVIVYDRAGGIVRMNPAAERVFGYSPEERELPIAERLACLRMETPDGRPVVVETSPAVRGLRGETYESELLAMHRHGRKVWLSCSAAPVRLADGEILGAVVTFENVTPMREMEEQRAQHVLGISHGLRTPLTVIHGRAQLLERMVSEFGLDLRSRETVQAIVSQTRRMSLVLKDLVDLTHLESGRPLSLNLEAIEMESLVTNLVSRLDGDAGSWRVHVDASADLPTIRVDADRIERALANLIANALHYSDAKTDVWVRLRRVGYELIVSVEDRGPGLPRESLPHLFDRLERARFIPARRNTMGLGLYIASGLVKAHGGRIWAESRAGEGSTFSLALPIREGNV